MTPVLFKLITFGAFNIGPCNPTKDNPEHSFFSFPTWWQYIETGHYDGLGNCTPEVKIPAGIWPIGLALVNMLLYVAGIVAVIMIMIAGVQYITAGGNPEKAASARQRVYNSLIGLAIVLVATSFVTFIGQRLG